MTHAVCLYCGKSKFGAITECIKCGKDSTGDFMLDITFSDRKMSRKTLRKFGSVIERISRETDGDEELQIKTLLKYVSDNYPDILTVDIAEPMATKVEALLEKMELPVFEVDIHPLNERSKRKGWRLRW